ncbi:hypothetical protein DB345_10300 [Spartobacteria bacterium LR76]|nr:hypothetical protein DB345_10300 [Spartobacteria bacterium LR76]
MKIFLCSTSFDLEDLRALAVNRFGDRHEFIHFEDAAFPSRRGLHSHDQCIEAVKQADVVVCIIDRRYGGHYRGKNSAAFPEQSLKFKVTVGTEKKTVETKIATKDLSISWCELLTAFEAEKYVITFARRRTLDEKATRRANQGVESFTPAHVDDIRVFDLLDWITKQPKDNWIIPFDTAVDFLEKLEKWLDVADASMVLPATPESRTQKPITVIVEGQTDAEVVKVIAKKYVVNRPLSLVVAQGKRALLGNLQMYAQAFKDSAGLIVLADADTSDDREIQIQKDQLQQIVANTGRSDIRVVFAVPEIEAWLGKTEFKRDRMSKFNKLHKELYHLQEELGARAKSMPSLSEFIEALKEFDRK